MSSPKTHGVIVTDWGEKIAPAEFDRRYSSAVKRLDGGVDRRYKFGRLMLSEEDKLITRFSRELADKS